MCGQLMYGIVQYWHSKVECHIIYEDLGFSKGLMKICGCEPWIAWVAANSLLHFTWVLMLLICQLYQVSAN